VGGSRFTHNKAAGWENGQVVHPEAGVGLRNTRVEPMESTTYIRFSNMCYLSDVLGCVRKGGGGWSMERRGGVLHC
jgi:hypothetical protein